MVWVWVGFGIGYGLDMGWILGQVMGRIFLILDKRSLVNGAGVLGQNRMGDLVWVWSGLGLRCVLEWVLG